jgi:hypothetical protein
MTEETFLKARQLRDQIKSYQHHILSLPVYDPHDYLSIIPQEMFERQLEEKRAYIEMEIAKLEAEFAVL